MNTYRRAVSLYSEFVLTVLHSTTFFPATTQYIMLYVTHLFNKGLCYSTIVTYISAISYFSKMMDLPDPSNAFITRKLLQAVKRSNFKPDTRLPITPFILKALSENLARLGLSLYDQLLLRAAYTLAFHALLRVGEFTSRAISDQSKILQVTDISFPPRPSGEAVLQVTIRHFKGNVGASPFHIFIQPAAETSICAYTAVLSYLHVRPQLPGPLFVRQDSTPLKREFFTSQLKLSLRAAELPVDRYKAHSFRIGSASFHASTGMSDNEIMKLGRWKSSAVQRYIRIPKVINSPPLTKRS